MATFTFVCLMCDAREEVHSPVGIVPFPPLHRHSNQLVELKRDYRTDAPRANLAHLRGEATTNREQADLFLPKAEDFASPLDPEGVKSLKKWQDEHQPKAGNTHPTWPSDNEVGHKSIF